MAEFTWKVTPEEAFGKLTENYIRNIRAQVLRICERYAEEIEQYMQTNAPWQDITEAARSELFAEVQELSSDIIRILLSHGLNVPYGSYLEGFTPAGIETRQGGKYAIIAPTVDVFGPRIQQEIRAMLRS